MPAHDILMSLIPLSLICALLVILVRRRLYTTYPFFFAYCALTLAATPLRLLVAKHEMYFFFVYWITESIYFTVALIAIINVLHPFAKVIYERRPWSVFVLPTVFLVTVSISLFFAVFHPIGLSVVGRFATGVYIFVPLMCLFEVALVIAAILIKQRYEIAWTRYEAGMLAGFFVLALLSLVGRLTGVFRILHLNVGPQMESLFRYSTSAAFFSSSIAWLITFWRREPPTTYQPSDAAKIRELAEAMQKAGERFEEWWRRLKWRLAIGMPNVVR